MTAPYAPPADPTAIEPRRIAAWTIDLVLFLVLLVVAVLATGGLDWTTKQLSSADAAVTYCEDYQGGDARQCVPFDDQAVILEANATPDLVWVVYSLAYVVLQGLAGGSVGKLALGLRVVDGRGQRAGVWKSFLRTVLWIVDAITCGVPVVGGVLITTTRGHRRVGDMVAGTFVVPKESVGFPVVVPPRQTQAPAPYVFHLPPPGYAPPPGYGPPPGAPPAQGPPPAPGGPPPYPPPAAPGWPSPAPWSDGSDPTVADRPLSRPSVDAPDTDGPHWDDDRDTYIQYDRAVEMWVQWDQKHQHWRPIDT